MSAYRSDEEVHRLRVAELARELDVLDRGNERLELELASVEAEEQFARDRLADAGPGGGTPDARRDRIGLGGLLLVGASAMLLPFHVAWHDHVASDWTVWPAMLLLGAPAALAVLVVRRHRREGKACALAFSLGVVLALLAPLHLIIGRFG